MTPEPTLATIAEYFRIGIQVGLVRPEAAIAWADAVIASVDTPEGEIVEVACSKGLSYTLNALIRVEGERNKSLAGRWLLELLGKTDFDLEEAFQTAVQQAHWIAWHAELGMEACNQFNSIDDQVSLARTKTYGSIDQCKIEFSNALLNISSSERLPDSIRGFR